MTRCQNQSCKVKLKEPSPDIDIDLCQKCKRYKKEYGYLPSKDKIKQLKEEGLWKK